MPTHDIILNKTSGNAFRKKILIVEDEVYLREVLRDKLIYEKFDVLEATNGEEGLNMAFKYKPDLILLDIILPVVDGFTFMKKLSEDRWGANVPVIIITNVGDMQAVVDMFERGIITIKNQHNAKSEFDIKIYLETRIGNNLNDYVIKTSCTLNEIVAKVKRVFSD